MHQFWNVCNHTCIMLIVLNFLIFCSDRICKNRYNLYYEDPDTEGLTSTTTEGKCLPAGMQGPCGNYMVISLDTRNITNVSKGVGVCECDVEHFARPMVYHEETKQCYFVFTQVKIVVYSKFIYIFCFSDVRITYNFQMVPK